MSPIGGRYEDVGLFDFASLYPNIILSNNFCYTTKCDGPGENILSLGNGTHWRQDKKGLLPSVVEEMLKLRKYYKQQMKNATDDDEKLGYDMLQMAVKVSVNAIYGLTGMKRVGGMWVDYDIARSITYKGRESIHMLVAESEKQGYKALAGHTDSAYIQVPYDKAEWLAQHLTDIAQNNLDMKYLDVEWEAYFPYWITAHETKNRNFGIKSYPLSEAGQMKVTGYEIKASYASQITKDIQETAFNLICNGKEEDDVKSAIVPFVNNLYNGNTSINDITSHARIQKDFKDYVSPTAAVQAAMYYNKYHANKNDIIKKGESVKWVYVNGVPNGQSSISFAAYKEENDLDDYSIDWYTVIEKLVTAKLKSVYEALGWNLQAVVKDNRMKSYW